MWPLVRDFFTVKSFAVRILRVAIVTAGTLVAGGQLPIPDEYKWVGAIVAGLGAAITSQPDTPKKENQDG